MTPAVVNKQRINTALSALGPYWGGLATTLKRHHDQPSVRTVCSFHSILRKVVGNIRFNRLRGSEICVTARLPASLNLRYATTVERICEPGVEPECGVVVGDGLVE